MIPMASHNLCGYIDEPLYTYYVRNDSHSHAQNSLEMKLKRYEGLEEILYQCIQVAPRMDCDYRKIIDEKAVRTRLRLYIEFNKKQKANEYYKKLRELKSCTYEDKRAYLKKYYPVRFYFFKMGNLLGRAIRKTLRIIGIKQ